MKKLLMIILIILLTTLTCFLVFKNISAFGWKSKNVNDIKKLNEQLTEEIKVADKTSKQDYPNSIEQVKDSIKQLKVTKEKYENKMKYVSEDIELGLMHIKRYKIEALWIALENYAKEENVELLLNVVQNSSINDSYSLQIAVFGEYNSIIDFLYDIEKDDELSFRIEEFEMHQYRVKTTSTKEDINYGISDPFESSTTTKTEAVGTDVVSSATQGELTVDTPPTEETVSYDPRWVEATFVVNNIGIENANGAFN